MKAHSLRHCVFLPVLLFCGWALLEVPASPNVGSTGDDIAPEPPVRILVAYCSRTGNTEQMAGGVVEGTRRVKGVVTMLKKVGDVSKEDLDAKLRSRICAQLLPAPLRPALSVQE